MTSITNAFKVIIAERIVASVGFANTSYYMYAGHSRSWDNDSSPPTLDQSPQFTQYATYDTMIFGKKLTTDDVVVLAKRVDWEANTVYDKFDDQDSDLESSNFYVTVNANTAYHVFKCLNNAGGAPSMYQPTFEDTAADDEFYFTADGYQWKYLYSITPTEFNKFSTSELIPVIPNANVTGNAVVGALDVILVENSGVGYNSYANGFFQEISVSGDALVHTIEASSAANGSFYNGCAIKITSGTGSGQQRVITEYIVSGGQKRIITNEVFDPLPDLTSHYEISPNVIITGDGDGAIARAIVNASSNTIGSIEITARGNSYNFATAAVIGNTGIANVSSNSFVTNNAVLRVVIGPKDGHGSDINNELFVSALGFATSFANTEMGTIPAAGHFRQVGIVRNPLFANVTFTVSNTAGTFTDDEQVVVDGTSTTVGRVTFFSSGLGALRLTDCAGNVEDGDTVRGATSNAVAVVDSYVIQGINKTFATFDQRVRFNATFGADPFNENDFITQDVTEATGYTQTANSTFFAITQPRGQFTPGLDTTTSDGKIASISAITQPDLVNIAGDVIYIDNIQPVSRDPELSESVKIVIKL